MMVIELIRMLERYPKHANVEVQSVRVVKGSMPVTILIEEATLNIVHNDCENTLKLEAVSR